MQSVDHREATGPGATPPLTAVERAALLEWAHGAIDAAVRHERFRDPPPEHRSPRVEQPQACFVTLTLAGNLRGCIGQLTAREPLWQAVLNNAVRAATRDFRFQPLTLGEAGAVQVEISVLTPSTPVSETSREGRLAALRAGVDGVVLESRGHVATFLPQVWEQLPDKATFLEHLGRKAGVAEDAWTAPETRLSVYQVESFEDDPVGASRVTGP